MMNQEDLFKKIGSILQELQDQYDFLAQNPQQLNELELELFQANASFLTDHIQIIKKINNSKPVRELPSPEPELPVAAPVKPVMDELFKPDQESPTFEFVLNDHSLSDKFDFEEKPVYEIFDRPLSPEEQEIIGRKQQFLAEQEQKVELEIPAAPVVEESSQANEPELLLEVPVDSLEETEQIPESNDDVEQVTDAPISFSEPTRSHLEFDFEPDEQTNDSIPPTTGDIEEEYLEVSEVSKPEALYQDEDEDEIGPEPFLVVEEKPVAAPVIAPAAVVEEPVEPIHKPTLNEMLAANNGASNNLGFERSRFPVTDLRTAINLNQKLLYIKDLFNGYNLAYAEVIDILNKMPDFKAADQFLQSNYAVKNDWASKPATVEQFYELLRLRFPD